MSNTKYHDIVTETRASYTCPYCKHIAKSSPGRTNHLKSCGSASEAEKAASKFRVGQEIDFERQHQTIIYIELGLVVLGNSKVVNASKLAMAQDKPIEAKIAASTTPTTLKEWVEQYIKRGRPASAIRILFKYSGFVKHKKWEIEALEALLRTTKTAPEPPPKPPIKLKTNMRVGMLMLHNELK